jgi:hypothetical protein
VLSFQHKILLARLQLYHFFFHFSITIPPSLKDLVLVFTSKTKITILYITQRTEGWEKEKEREREREVIFF